MFFLYFCYVKKNYVIVEVKKNDVIYYERNVNCFFYLKKIIIIKLFFNKV